MDSIELGLTNYVLEPNLKSGSFKPLEKDFFYLLPATSLANICLSSYLWSYGFKMAVLPQISHPHSRQEGRRREKEELASTCFRRTKAFPKSLSFFHLLISQNCIIWPPQVPKCLREKQIFLDSTLSIQMKLRFFSVRKKRRMSIQWTTRCWCADKGSMESEENFIDQQFSTFHLIAHIN